MGNVVNLDEDLDITLYSQLFMRQIKNLYPVLKNHMERANREA